MKFLYSDTQDYVDPNYDFLTDSSPADRERYWHDQYAHELMANAPYDGLLISMSAIRKADGVAASKVRYSTAEEQRLLREGARRFLRFDGPKHRNLMLMGDCGAFAYVDHPEPAYTPEQVVEFYLDTEVTHGVSPDHVIFECDLDNPPPHATSAENRRRFEITLENARKFRKLSRIEGDEFEPMGAIQGWSPKSMAEAAAELVRMGYSYLAVGGLVPLKVDAIKVVLQTIRDRIGPDPKLHLLGFAKADHIGQFTGFGISSFDSTSPLIRAFKDAKCNYYLENSRGSLDYFTAIRVPQAWENSRLLQGIKRGIFDAEDLKRKEESTLRLLRNFDRGSAGVDEAADAVMDYSQFLVRGDPKASEKAQDNTLSKTRAQIMRTLESRPWKSCNCDICRAVGIEVIIFRGSNRNRRRGFHNLGVYHRHVQKTLAS